MAAISDEHGESFKHEISQKEESTVENGVQIFLVTAPGIIRETPTVEYKREKGWSDWLMTNLFVVMVPCIETFFMNWH